MHYCVQVIRNIIVQIRDLLGIFKEQNDFVFFATSLLIYFEEDVEEVQTGLSLIDFTHVFPMDDKSKRDDNIIYGLEVSGFTFFTAFLIHIIHKKYINTCK